jgi:hypothetical protein
MDRRRRDVGQYPQICKDQRAHQVQQEVRERVEAMERQSHLHRQHLVQPDRSDLLVRKD